MGYSGFSDTNYSSNDDLHDHREKPNADKIWNFIEANENMDNDYMVLYLNNRYKISQDNVRNAIVRWAMGDKKWFYDTFK